MRAPNSTPIVRSCTGWKRLSVNCSSRQDLPTPVSPAGGGKGWRGLRAGCGAAASCRPLPRPPPRPPPLPAKPPPSDAVAPSCARRTDYYVPAEAEQRGWWASERSAPRKRRGGAQTVARRPQQQIWITDLNRYAYDIVLSAVCALYARVTARARAAGTRQGLGARFEGPQEQR